MSNKLLLKSAIFSLEVMMSFLPDATENDLQDAFAAFGTQLRKPT